MRVRHSVLATACVSLGSLFFFGCGGPRLRSDEQIKADLVGMRLNARTNLALSTTPDLESGSSMDWTIKPCQIESLRILRRKTDKKGGTDIVYANIQFQAAKVKFNAAQGEELIVRGEGDLKLHYRLQGNGWLLDSVDAESKFRVMTWSAAAVGSLRTLLMAEETYSTYYNRGFSPNLSSLGQGRCAQLSEKCAGLIDDALALGTKFGYKFTYVPGIANQGRISTFTINADPASPADMGAAHYFVDPSGVIRMESGTPARAKSPALAG